MEKRFGRSSGKKGVRQPHLCLDCGETSPDNFYGDQRGRCKKCHVKVTSERRVKAKLDAIAYLGGKCKHCGYDRYYGALEFHHTDPTKKDPEKFSAWRTLDIFYAELDKCILLCSNCHAEEHHRLRTVGRVADADGLLNR